MAHGIGILPLLVGRPGSSGELETQQPNCDSNSTTMMRELGSSEDSRYHRESLREDAMVKIEPTMEASAKEGLLQTQEKRVPRSSVFWKVTDEKKPKKED